MVFFSEIAFIDLKLHEIKQCIYLFSFVETPRKFIIAELSIRKLGSSSVLIIRALLYSLVNVIT